MPSVRVDPCLVARPFTRLRHMWKELRFMCLRMMARTWFSLMPYCISMASKGVRSSQAISTMRSTVSSSRSRGASFFRFLGSKGSMLSKQRIDGDVSSQPDFYRLRKTATVNQISPAISRQKPALESTTAPIK